MAPSPIVIDVLEQAGDWPPLNPERAVQAAIAVLDKPRQGELSIVLTDDVHIQQLNRDYRHKDKPTNVLSFPQDGAMLGDIILAWETVQREAAKKHVSLGDHFTHLVIHGFLHLQGYDHEIDAEAKQMEALEIQALSALNIDNPYEIRNDS